MEVFVININTDLLDRAIDLLFNSADVGAYLDKSVISILLDIKNNDMPEYSRYIEKLKKSGASISLLKSALKKYEEEQLTSDNSETGIRLNQDGSFHSINQNIFVRYLLKHFTLVYTDGDMFYRYQNGVYKYISMHELKKLIREFLHDIHDNIWNLRSETLYMAALKLESPYVKQMNADKSILNLNNGILCLDNFELKAHSPDYYTSIRIPIDYEPEAKCPLFIEFLNEVLCEDRDLVNIVQEMMGYCTTAEIKAQTAFILLGSGSNGKSCLIDIMQKIVGDENVSNIALADLDNQFSKSNLVNKVLNAASENEFNGHPFSSQFFKSIVTGDKIQIDQKYKEPYSYAPFCKLVYAMNSLPKISDVSHGLFRRLKIIPFNRRFTPDQADKDLPQKLGNELPAILNYALEGLKRLRENNYEFTSSEVSAGKVNEYIQDMNPMVAFFDETFNLSCNKRLSRKEVVDYFDLYCKQNKLVKYSDMPPRTFWQTLRKVMEDKGVDYHETKSNGVDYIIGITPRKRILIASGKNSGND